MECFVSTAYVNAWSIRRGLRMLGLECRSLDPAGGLVPPAHRQPGAGDVLFFTEEDSLMRFLTQGPPGCLFHPRSVPVSPDDKLAFADAMRDIGESPVPYWPIKGDVPPEPPVLPVVLKCRHSWRDGRKLDRGYVCMDAREYRDAADRLQRNGIDTRDFFLQEYLPDATVVSTCGFFDAANPARNLILVTRKVLGHGSRMTTGVIVETVADPEGLVPRTLTVLDALRYRGPFELEFVHDAQRSVHHVLELNMRFWMQHGLFIDGCGNQLLARYLDRDHPADVVQVPSSDRPLMWIDGVALVDALAMLRLRSLTAMWGAWRAARRRGGRIVMHPDIVSALGFRCRWTVRMIGRMMALTVRTPPR
jgi:hypothetical protein